MKYAIISDIHNHSQALNAVLDHINQQGVDACYCLGDVGADACVDIIRANHAPTVFGNWEASNWRLLSKENQQWALSLPPLIHPNETVCLTHAAPFWPHRIKSLAALIDNPQVRYNGNLFPYLDFEEDSIWKAIAKLTDAGVTLMFHGHTHRQLVWRFTRTNKLLREHKRAFQLIEGETYLVGVGSVGQPKDGPGAAYALFDDQTNTVELVKLHQRI